MSKNPSKRSNHISRSMHRGLFSADRIEWRLPDGELIVASRNGKTWSLFGVPNGGCETSFAEHGLAFFTAISKALIRFKAATAPEEKR